MWVSINTAASILPNANSVLMLIGINKNYISLRKAINRSLFLFFLFFVVPVLNCLSCPMIQQRSHDICTLAHITSLMCQLTFEPKCP